MKVKTFRGRTMGEALNRVKDSMGNGAVILFTRTVRGRGFLGIMGRQVVEIGAVPDGDMAAHRGGARAGRAARVEGAKATRCVERAYGNARTAAPGVESEDIRQIHQELKVVRESVENAIRQSCGTDVADLPTPLVDIYLDLVRREMCRLTVARVLKEVGGEMGSGSLTQATSLNEMVASKLAKLVTVSGPVALAGKGRPRVVAFVGPTGVGKTTTVAKLAGDLNVCKGRKVGLITIDTYRIAAVQQLKTIADIVGVPLKTVLTVDELQAAVADFRDKDVVIIDTAGRGQRDEFKMNELASFVQAAHPDETHLVLAATARPNNMREVLDRFKPVGVDRLVLSKVDEAEGIGAAFTVASESGLPVSYVTNGQDIPEDIELAEPMKLARMVVFGTMGNGAKGTGVRMVGEAIA